MSFDRLAPHYRWMEFLLAGEKLQRCRTAFLDQVTGAGRILLLGEGNGRFLPVCCARFPAAHIDCVDASAGMIVQARRRLRQQGIPDPRVTFIHADALTWAPARGEPYDLIVTNFFLDCFRAEQLERIISAVGRRAAPAANWLVADFQAAANGLCRVRSELILVIMYSFFRIATRLSAQRLTPPDPFLEQAGFVLRRRKQADWALLHSDWWQRGGPR
jgi:ubiquinone/menaquinone biosynthesis C-methylase UbiE